MPTPFDRRGLVLALPAPKGKQSIALPFNLSTNVDRGDGGPLPNATRNPREGNGRRSKVGFPPCFKATPQGGIKRGAANGQAAARRRPQGQPGPPAAALAARPAPKGCSWGAGPGPPARAAPLDQNGKRLKTI